MLTLYHAPQSRSSRIVWLLEELNADYEIVYTAIPRMDGSGAADPNNPHPEGKVPTLVHDGVLIMESIAIALYLADLYPDAGLAPPVNSPARGPYLTWLAYYAGVVEPVMHFQFLGLDNQEGLTRTFRGRAELDKRILDGLADGLYLVGDTFTAADIMYASMGQWARDMLPKGDVIDSYIERCCNRPALETAMAKDSPPG